MNTDLTAARARDLASLLTEAEFHAPSAAFTRYEVASYLRACAESLERGAENLPADSAGAWPPLAVLARLAEFAEDRLVRKDYDGHGYEELRICVDRAREILGGA